MKEKLMKFMYGRYGNDELNQFLFKVVFACLLLSFLGGRTSIGNLFYNIGILLVVLIYFRMFSKNYSKRYAEKESFLAFSNKVNRRRQEKKSYAFFKCPSCKQKVRVPKGKGKISIHCPKCNVDFIKRS